MQLDRVRTALASVDRQIATLLAQGNTAGAAGLADSWALLVKELDVGPEPLTRACPVCHKSCMRAATLCGYCWAPLTPPATGEA
jgi:hypothetical protein